MASDPFPGATLVQLNEWGYPMGSLRPTPDPALAFSVVHITANLALAQNEVAWRLNDPGLQNSATFFVNQDGSIIQALGDPLHMDPWTNGDVASPDTSNPRIAAVVRDGVNANERSLVTIENVGREPEAAITAAQEDADARIIAYYHAKASVPVTRETVIGHYQINSINRPNCPSRDKSLIDRIVAQAGGSMGADMPPLTTSVPAQTTLKVAAGETLVPVRSTPSYGAPLVYALNGGVVTTIGTVVNGESTWYVWWDTSPGKKGWLYVPAPNVPMSVPMGIGGITQAQLDAAVAKAAMDAKVAAAKAAATETAKRASDYAASLPTP